MDLYSSSIKTETRPLLITSHLFMGTKSILPYLGYGRKKFYSEIKKGEIEQPTRLSEKDVFGYES